MRRIALRFRLGHRGLQVLGGDPGVPWRLQSSYLELLPPGLIFNSGGYVEGTPEATGPRTFIALQGTAVAQVTIEVSE